MYILDPAALVTAKNGLISDFRKFADDTVSTSDRGVALLAEYKSFVVNGISFSHSDLAGENGGLQPIDLHIFGVMFQGFDTFMRTSIQVTYPALYSDGTPILNEQGQPTMTTVNIPPGVAMRMFKRGLTVAPIPPNNPNS